MSQVVTMPRPDAPIAGGERAAPEYWRFLDGLVRRVGRGGVSPAEIKIVGGPGTKTFTADVPGTVYFHGGSAISVEFVRGAVTVPLPFANGSVHLAIGDVFRISYNGIPTATWVPD